MTAIGPTTTTPARRPTPTRHRASTNQLNENTFLTLLVAQMKYQDPIEPDRQHAVPHPDRAVHRGETLQQIEADQQATQQSAASCSRRAAWSAAGVTYSTTGIAPATPVATTTVSVGGNLAPGRRPSAATIDVEHHRVQRHRREDPDRARVHHDRRPAGRCRRSSDGPEHRRPVAGHVRRDRRAHQRRRHAPAVGPRRHRRHRGQLARDRRHDQRWARPTDPTRARERARHRRACRCRTERQRRADR